MTIDEAIKEIQNEIDEHPSCINLPYYKALGLGIEALKDVKKRQEQFPELPHLLLPGQARQ